MPYIKVSFYDEDNQKKLEETPNYKIIQKLVEEGFTCSNEDLWTYSLFKEQKNFEGYRNFQELKYKLSRRLDRIEDYFVLKDYTIRAKFPEAKNQELTEEVGIGAALALISKIHGLTQADWNIIPITKNKDLDFYINPELKKSIKKPDKTIKHTKINNQNESLLKVASDAERFIELEAKGSYVNLDTKSLVSGAKGDIEEKKKYQREKQNNKNLLYGVITSYSASKEVIAHSRILDPPAMYSPDDNPRKLRLLSRLSFYLENLNLISKPAYLIALANRIADITALSDYEALNNRPLVNRFSERFEIPVSYTRSRTELYIENFKIIGEASPLNETRFLFFGVDAIIIAKMIEQNIIELLDYRCGLPRSFEAIVDAKVKRQELITFRNVEDLSFAPDRSRVLITLSGLLHTNAAGIVWGYLY